VLGQHSVSALAMLCFFNEQVDVDVDGERQPRPETPWSGGATAGEM
jgi:hypothetical protein